ncbi:hypothetical protein AB0M44_11275 [Streptosporangium subroseum]|uniref:hypothetical protein n=1 Tax=Streptosporangium subroseum TaxID=106412 RepID=UPI003449E123
MRAELRGTQDAAEERAEKGISEAKAEEYNGALANVQRLLKREGIRSFSVRPIDLKLISTGGPYPMGQSRWHAPELVIPSDAGWVAATVIMRPSSGCYPVSIRNGPDLQTVREPQQVADLILTAQPGGRS